MIDISRTHCYKYGRDCLACRCVISCPGRATCWALQPHLLLPTSPTSHQPHSRTIPAVVMPPKRKGSIPSLYLSVYLSIAPHSLDRNTDISQARLLPPLPPLSVPAPLHPPPRTWAAAMTTLTTKNTRAEKRDKLSLVWPSTTFPQLA